MTDRTDNAPEHDAVLDADYETPTDEELTTSALEEGLDAERFADDPYPQGPNDEGFGASPPIEAGHPRLSDDDDLDTEGSGLQDTPFRAAYEDAARRSDLARRLEELLVDVQEWAHEDSSEAARWILEALTDAYEILDAPPEESGAEDDVLQAEPSRLGKGSATQRGLASGNPSDDEAQQE
jgi:hypothetical protein